MQKWALVLVLTAALIGCSDESNNKDMGVDALATDFTYTVKDGAGLEKYPAGPYGTKAGEVAANLNFVIGKMDPKNFCKSPKDKVPENNHKDPFLSFGDYHRGDPAAACKKYKPKLLWVMVSAGWCAPCVNEVMATQKQYTAGAISPGLDLLNIVFEDKSYGPATPAFAQLWANQLGVTFPVVADPEFKMGAYFAKAAVPFNMLVDTSNMKIFYRQTGGSLTGIGKKIAEFMAKK